MKRRERSEQRSLRRNAGGGTGLRELGPLIEELELGQRAPEEHGGLAIRTGCQGLRDLGEDAGVERAGQPRRLLDFACGDGGQRVLRCGAHQAEGSVERRLGVTVATREQVLERQRIRFSRIAAERLAGERPGPLGLVLDQQGVKPGQGHGARCGARVLRPIRGVVEHRGGSGWGMGAGAEREHEGGEETTHRRVSCDRARRSEVTSWRGEWWVPGSGG